uniref:Uncharacterized protein n=1 Tax=Setaria viridis TaxID=4556 RepID=A0A4U6UJP4_SETVI|nr:hypothetical protein SEVIR_5G226050v2 [Setaria viridis]
MYCSIPAIWRRGSANPRWRAGGTVNWRRGVREVDGCARRCLLLIQKPWHIFWLIREPSYSILFSRKMGLLSCYSFLDVIWEEFASTCSS